MLAAAVLPALLGVWMLLRGGLLLEPVSVQVGRCPGEEPCVQVRCVFENQGPVRTRGGVLIDVWTIDPRDVDGHRREGHSTRRADLDLRARERSTLVFEIPGLEHRPGKTMVRCMPWFAAPRLFISGGVY